MDSPLMGTEFAGEDDSPLVQSSSSPGFRNFACSPLRILGSRTPRVPRLPRSGAAGLASPKNSPLPRSNKENVNTSNINVGTPNGCVEPQQTKRRKKGGGYNLRKSLAWNKAFFTEEGVLDSSELSMVCGVSSNHDIEELSSICEDETEPMLINSNGISGLRGLRSLEEDLFKELPCSRPREQQTRGTVMQKQVPQECHAQGILPAHTVKECMLAGRGCLSSSASISQKRLLNTITTKVVARNSKIPKIPAPKQDSSASNTVAKTGTPKASHSKGSRIPKPGASVPKSANLKGFSKARGSPDAATRSRGRSSKSSKTVPQSSTKNVGTSCRETNSLTHPALSSKKTKHSKVTTEKVHLLNELDAAKALNGTRKVGVSSSQTSYGTASSSALPVQATKVTKPSGLRMPSPSLKFFSETNAPTAKSLLHGNIQAPKAHSAIQKTSIPISSAAASSGYKHEMKPPHATGQSCKLVDQKYLEHESVYVKDELTCGNNIKLASSNLESTAELHRTFNELSKAPPDDDLLPENSMVCHETCPAAELLRVEVSTKKHVEDEQNDGLKPDSQFEDAGVICDQWTSAAPVSFGGGIATKSTNFHEDENAPKLDKNAYVMCMSSERKSGEGNCDPDASKFLGFGVAIEESNLGTANNAYNQSSKSCAAVSDIGRDHSQQMGVECLDSDDRYDSLILHNELATRNNVAIDPLLEPVEENRFWQEMAEPSSKENEYYTKFEKGKKENDLNTSQEVFTTAVDRLLKRPLENGTNESFCSNHSTDHGQCHQVTNSIQEQHGQQELLNVSHMTNNVIMFADSNDDILVNECPILERFTEGGALQIALNSNITDKAHIVEETPSSCLETDLRDGPCLNLVSNLQCHGRESSPQCTHLLSPSSGMTSNDQDTSPPHQCNVGRSSRNQTQSTEDISAIDGSLEQDMTVDKLENPAFPTDAAGTTSCCDIPNEESACESKGIPCKEEGNAQMAMKTSKDDEKQGGFAIKLPTNAVPFSDEWLAVIEAAGEEILTSKGGRVQNSPPDKPLPEPSPWSPVKRKTNQVLGPYDCTKFTNIQH